MANTYTQLYVQIVFAVEARQNLIRREHQEELHRYISGIVTQQEQKLMAIHAMPDHLHLLLGFKPTVALSDLVGAIKAGSTNHINWSRWMAGRFSWQDGFGAFTYGNSQLGQVIRYIHNQEQHHAKKTFTEEYLALLDRFQISHDQRYIFKPVLESANPSLPPSPTRGDMYVEPDPGMHKAP